MQNLSASLLAIAAITLGAAPAQAEDIAGMDMRGTGAGAELPAYLECVPYARALSGIQIYGDAWTWWDKADGIYPRGKAPQQGAVLAFVPHGAMRLGHVAAVSRVVDSRTVLLSHANWSPIDGRRGQVERDVKAIDVSPANDWSQVRVWYGPSEGLGTTAWPTHGFIYPKAPPKAQPRRALLVATSAPPVRAQSSARFSAAFADLAAPPTGPTRPAPRLAGAPVDLVGEIIRRR
jgi:surface antigen